MTGSPACTFFTAQVDFTEPGELGVFIDEDQLASVEEMMSKKGYLEGSEMATTFNMLRANDLIWSFVVNNYLMGKDPFPFDLLFWNADATRMPAAMHSYYLRNMYQKNLLVKPGGLVIDNVPIDLRKISIPVYLQAWQGRPHRARQVGLQGDADLQRPGALHAGGLGPHRRRRQSAAHKKYQHWLNETAKNPPTLDEWRAGARSSRLVVARLGQVAVSANVRVPRCPVRACRRMAACRRFEERAGSSPREGAH
jgi:polyhydroxyalkanoate synthase